MATYNMENYLPASVESILLQTLDDFELIIVDDGSTDTTWEQLTKYADSDQRVILLRNSSNSGLSLSLNRSIHQSKGQYIARMDADDVSSKDRLSRQLESFKNDSTIVLCGTNGLYVRHDLTPLRPTILPVNDWSLRCICLFENPFMHSSVMMTASTVKSCGGYDVTLDAAQDYELWTRVMEHGKVSNLSDRLVLFRRHEASISETRRKLQMENKIQIQKKYVSSFLKNCDLDDSKYLAMNRDLFFENTFLKDEVRSHTGIKFALNLLSCFQSTYPECSHKYLKGYILGRCLMSAIMTIRQPGGWQALGRLVYKHFSSTPFGLLWLMRQSSVTVGAIGLLETCRIVSRNHR